ncbi:MAG: tetratricopeptide repeat protein, partial [Actinomycetota bacterium]
VGRGGAGKTRLAFEFLLQIAERLPNWEAGLLTGTVLRKFDATKQPSDWRWSAPTLVVVDYAQPLAAPLGELLRALTHRRRQADLPPLRLLLLERAPGGWFEDLLNQEDSGGQCAVRELFDPPEPVELTPIPTGQLRRAVLTQVLEKAAGLAGRPPPPLPAEGDSTFAKSLNRDLFAEPLNLYMAALAASDLGLNAALNRSRPDLALVLAGKELERICRFVRHAGNDAQETLLCHLAACATVERGFTDDECRRAVAEEYEVLGRSWPDGLGDLQEVLERALPGERLPVASIEPDFIGEAVVLKMLAKPAPGASARWARWRATMARCFQRDPFATASTLMNAFQNFGHLEGHGEALLQATERLIEVGLADTARPLLVCIEAALPQQTVTLRPHAVRVTQAIYEQLKDRVTPNNEPSLRAELARVASNLGVRLSNLGRRLEALPPAEEAVKLYRELFEQNPDAFRPDLAKSLGMMGQVREANQQADLALECFAQGIRVLAPQFMSLPTAFAQIMGQLGQDYLRLAERLGREPDASLLTPVAEVLQRLESGAPPGKGAPPDL